MGNRKDLLGGVTVFESTAIIHAFETVGTELYRALKTAEKQRIPVRLIPYYAWNNRGERKMTVWIPMGD